MYVARFSYNIKPVDRDKAIDLLRQSVTAASEEGHPGRLLVPLTRAPGGPALQVEVEFESLDTFERYRDQGLGSADDTRSWIRELSDILLDPPVVELLRGDGGNDDSGNRRNLAGNAASEQDDAGDEPRRRLIGGHVSRA